MYDDDGNLKSYLPCKKWPKTGSRVCDKHGGAAPQVRRAAERRAAEAELRQEVDRLGIPVIIDPTEALLNEIWETVGNVEYLRGRVQELAPSPGEEGSDGVEGSLYSRMYHQTGMPTGEAKPHVLVQMYNEERRHLVTVTQAAIRLGIEERRVRLEESRAQEVFRAISIAFGQMGLEDKFDAFRAKFADAVAQLRRGE